MYAVIEKNKLTISVAEFYAMDWYERDHFPSHEETYPFDYGRLEIDIHKNGRKYLTGFTLDPRLFVVDYLKTRYAKDFKPPRKVQLISIDTGRHQMFCVDFLKVRSFVIDGMEKDLIFPQFCRRKGEFVIQGFEVLDVFAVIQYLARRFDYKETTLIRQGDRAYNLKTKRWRKIRLGQKKIKKPTAKGQKTLKNKNSQF